MNDKQAYYHDFEIFLMNNKTRQLRSKIDQATIKNISVSPYPTHNYGSG
jgi:hypothetical protein